MLRIFNLDLLAAEFVRSLVGSVGLALSIPLPAAAGAFLLVRQPLLGNIHLWTLLSPHPAAIDGNDLALQIFGGIGRKKHCDVLSCLPGVPQPAAGRESGPEWPAPVRCFFAGLPSFL